MSRRRPRPPAPPPPPPRQREPVDDRPIPWTLYAASGVPTGYIELYMVDEAERLVFRVLFEDARWHTRGRELRRLLTALGAALRDPERPPLRLCR